MWIWDPARSHNGITNKFAFSFSVGERKIMTHFAVQSVFLVAALQQCEVSR